MPPRRARVQRCGAPSCVGRFLRIGWLVLGGGVLEDAVDRFGCFGLHVGEEVGVDLEREADAGVAEAFGDDFWVDAFEQHEGGVAVA